jgi:glycosyltransferase involved in cell wall biosynthesis
VVDLNPRSITAWMLLLLRRIQRKRTLVWGHIYPRKGPDSLTVPLRNFMRGLADGVICYTWQDREVVRDHNPSTRTWVAANGLYSQEEMRVDACNDRRDLVYVGRLVAEKKVELLISAFADYRLSRDDLSRHRLVIVGDGPERANLERRVIAANLKEFVDFKGHVAEAQTLRDIYKKAICSVSPGYAGLSLTQSLGFGVPMVVARSEPHAPEIELMSDATGVWFRENDPRDLARALRSVYDDLPAWDTRRSAMVDFVSRTYSAEAMVCGFACALRNLEQTDRGH